MIIYKVNQKNIKNWKNLLKKNLKVLIEENKNNEQKNFHDQKEIIDIQEPDDDNNKGDEGEDLDGEFDEDDEHF